MDDLLYYMDDLLSIFMSRNVDDDNILKNSFV